MERSEEEKIKRIKYLWGKIRKEWMAIKFIKK